VTSTGSDIPQNRSDVVFSRLPHLTHSHPQHTHRALTVLREAEQSSDKAAGTDVPFELRGFSLATVGLVLGGVITVGSLFEVRQTQNRRGQWGSREFFFIGLINLVLSFFDSNDGLARHPPHTRLPLSTLPFLTPHSTSSVPARRACQASALCTASPSS